jgi:hypothetical protein
MTSSLWSHLLEPTPIDPTRIVAVPYFPFASSSLHKIADKSFLASLSNVFTRSHSSTNSSSFWSATPVNGPSQQSTLSLGLVDDAIESTGYEHKADKISKSPQYLALWSKDGIEGHRKMNLAALLSPCDDYHASHCTTAPSLLGNGCLEGRQDTSQFLVCCCSPEPSSSKKLPPPSQNSSAPIRSVVATENKEWNKNQQTARPFRMHQSHQWFMQYLEMVAFREKYGHCLVPLNWPANPSLAHWVSCADDPQPTLTRLHSRTTHPLPFLRFFMCPYFQVKRQRYQYRAKQKNRRSTLTADRQEMLENLGFVWDSHALVWEERWHELREFKEKYGHCRVPKTYAANPQLAVWVKVSASKKQPRLRTSALLFASWLRLYHPFGVH